MVYIELPCKSITSEFRLYIAIRHLCLPNLRFFHIITIIIILIIQRGRQSFSYISHCIITTVVTIRIREIGIIIMAITVAIAMAITMIITIIKTELTMIIVVMIKITTVVMQVAKIMIVQKRQSVFMN